MSDLATQGRVKGDGMPDTGIGDVEVLSCFLELGRSTSGLVVDLETGCCRAKDGGSGGGG